MVAIQAGLAAGLAWTAAGAVALDNNPVFAPIAAVGTVAAAAGQRLRRTVELVVGVALGAAVADGLVVVVDRGAWQIAVIAAVTIATAIAVVGRGSLSTQAGGTAVLVTSVAPASERVDAPQVFNAVLGGTSALVVVLLLLPLNPLRIVERAAGPELDDLSHQLTEVGHALVRRDPAAVADSLQGLRSMGAQLTQLSDAVQGGLEVVRYSPQRFRWRSTLREYRIGAEHLDRAVLGARGLARRAYTAISDDEPIPAVLGHAVVDLGHAVGSLHAEFVRGREPSSARHHALRAVHQAGHAARDGLGLSGTVVMAQIRTIARDLLRATAISRTDANRMVRQATQR
ncbi:MULTISPECIES: FUSC family protein [unclassified Micromonospora]|uniref:FUSC family protein n=1 Tax=unclassified Micromonospora TaxID=2617518 RepID=UPI001C2408F6|nr:MULTISPECIES: FUSC family protein [unclassified Micromonospora]MBU8861817.1 FUSC family protein [Micromonospora sp. WMMB482]MDM4781398.1 FUSC family protein [Micromonospora sp. b486]